MYKNYTDQINILISRGMNITNDSSTRKLFSELNYYNIINAFKKPFLDSSSTTEMFIPGTQFSEILNLFYFDRSLRRLLLDNILIIENSLKTKIAYEFSKNYNEFDYYNINHYAHSLHEETVNSVQLIKSISDKIEKQSKSGIYTHFIPNREIPIWAAVNFLDFGNIRVLYSSLNSSIQFDIANCYSLSTTSLQTMLSAINMFRNVCAHDNRIAEYRITNRQYQIADTPLHANLLINRIGTQYIFGKQDLFSIFISFRYLLSDNQFKKFFNVFKNLVSHLTNKLTTISIDEIFKLYSLPSYDSITGQKGWEDIINVAK